MYKWNEERIDQNKEKLHWVLTHDLCNNNSISYFSGILSYQYERIEKILNQVKVLNTENQKYEQSPFLKYIFDNMIFINTELYHFEAIENVKLFLSVFNVEYYDYFCETLHNGLIFLDINNNDTTIQEHIIDPVHRDCFIYVCSNNIGEEKYALLRQFGYAFQASKNINGFKEDDISNKDAFPLFLEMSMISFYNKNVKDSLVRDLEEVIKNHEEIINIKVPNIIPINDGIQITEIDRTYLSKQIDTSKLAIQMYKNNGIEQSFKLIDEFFEKNHNNISAEDLETILNKNMKGNTNPIKQKGLKIAGGKSRFE